MLAIVGLVLLVGIAAAASLLQLKPPLVSQWLSIAPEVPKPSGASGAEKSPPEPPPQHVEVLPAAPWVDSVFSSLTVDEKIGQLFMISAYSNKREAEHKAVEDLIRQYNIGGVLFFQGGPVRQASLTNRYQAAAKVPLLIGLDAEWGLGMRLDSTQSFPRQMALGAIQDPGLLYKMGEEIGRQCRRIGVHVNFAPVADINSNPKNPVIGNRSFGDNKNNVAVRAAAYMKGLQRQRVIAVAKHFPGHGDTDMDSHRTLPVLNQSREQLIETELYPFRRLIRDSVVAIMSGHLQVPALDSQSGLPASLSKLVIEGMLRKAMGFKGIVFTDAMNMKGVLNSGKPSEVNVKALLAGNDMVLAPEQVAESIQAFKAALAEGRVSEAVLDEKVKRILRGKYFAGLSQYVPADLNSIADDLNTARAEGLKRELTEASVTVVKNKASVLPLTNRSTVASVSIGEGGATPFRNMLDKLGTVTHFDFAKSGDGSSGAGALLKTLTEYETVIVGLYGVSSAHARNFNIPGEAVTLLDSLRQMGRKTVVCVMGSPYGLEVLPDADAFLVTYQADAYAQEAAAQIIFGALKPKGMLAAAAGRFASGTRAEVVQVERLGYTAPDVAGLSGDVLSSIDYLVQDAIMRKAFPGCQVLIAHSGRIVFEKNYGSLTYEKPEPVTSETLYDLASVTKIAATLQAVMFLYDRKKISLDEKVAFYLPELKGTNKADITIRELLIHQGGLRSFYPKLWESTMLSPTRLSGTYYKSEPDDTFSLRVSPTLYVNNTVRDSVWRWIIESPMNRRSNGKYPYVYSDLGFYMLQKVVERVSGTGLDAFVYKNFYQPLGLKNLLYNPLEKTGADHIAPTENDGRYRGELLRGTVHDQMAALCGGLSGHAGLFGNARDLAVLLQMNLWKGEYAGRQYLKPETVSLFTRAQEGKRGLGWDKPKSSGSSTYLSDLASGSSYGHTGFTGNVVWVDPEKDLIFILLSNRVYPSVDNNRINTLKVRRRIQDVAYEALLRNEPI
ncbi:glycoside hydrolase family 3 N-terminal domain-containing protein [Ravibacter arvi]|uniref:beta-N-acetylhexosaminidase n=1 Tax=Ravibacter arvi TaxID=2051041 RepID=A0ABP8LY51_9BACT